MQILKRQHVWNAVIAVSWNLVYAPAAPIAAPRQRWVNINFYFPNPHSPPKKDFKNRHKNEWN